MNHPARPLADVSVLVAIGNWITNYGPTAITVIGGIIGAAYYLYLIYDLHDQRKNRPKPRKKR
jgi:hypothetical protein